MYKELHKLDADELDRLSLSIDNHAAKMCEVLFPNRPVGHQSVVKNIGQWAINRKVVLDNKANGNPHIAVIFDKICYRIWQKLPGYAQSLKIAVNSADWKDIETPFKRCESQAYQDANSRIQD